MTAGEIENESLVGSEVDYECAIAGQNRVAIGQSVNAREDQTLKKGLSFLEESHPQKMSIYFGCRTIYNTSSKFFFEHKHEVSQFVKDKAIKIVHITQISASVFQIAPYTPVSDCWPWSSFCIWAVPQPVCRSHQPAICLQMASPLAEN